MDIQNIEVLKDKVKKDPSSKLFLPLAEAYKERGMLDESTKVLLQGLEKQPEYHSARVALGKVYLKKDMLAEAQAEFAKVVEAVPDNLFAHKKLMEIYYHNSDLDGVERECNIILTLNEDDEEASTMLYAIKEGQEEEQATQQEQVINQEAESVIEAQGEDKAEGNETGGTTESAPPSEQVETEAIIKEETQAELKVDEAEKVEKHVILPTETMADICITQGLYHEAMRIYESILSKDPDNKRFLQRRSELKTLISLVESRKKDYAVKRLARVADKIEQKSNTHNTEAGAK